MTLRRRLAALLLAAAWISAGWLVAGAVAAHAQQPGLGASVELVDPHNFRVCADPRSLPFSDEQQRGFEDKIAALFARQLGEPVQFTYFPRAIGFVRETLNLIRCDVVMGDVIGDDLVQPTNPYYYTTYVLVYRRGTGLDGLTSLEDKRLQGKHIGVIARTPPSSLLVRDGLMAQAVPYQLMVDTRVDAPSKSMIDDLTAGRIDAALLWGPIGGYYAKLSKTPLTVVSLSGEQGAPMVFGIVMGVRHSDQAWKRKLNGLIVANQDEINRILVSYGVPLLDSQGKPLTP